LDQSVLKIKTKIVSCHTADSKPVKQEVNSRVILPPLVFPGKTQMQTQKSKTQNAKRKMQIANVFFPFCPKMEQLQENYHKHWTRMERLAWNKRSSLLRM
jgi:hypothetical protein